MTANKPKKPQPTPFRVLSDEIPEPKNLQQAVANVMAEGKRLVKDQMNSFANYNFTSVDDYKDFYRPLFAKNGLSIIQNEVHFEFFRTEKAGKFTDNCVYKYCFRLRHSSGEEGSEEHATVALPFVGAQTNGIARSYALKEYLKSVVMASSGDLAEDADYEKLTLSKAQIRELGIWENLETSIREVGNNGTKEDLKGWYEINRIMVDALPDDFRKMLQVEFKQAQLAVEARSQSEKKDVLPADHNNWLLGFEAELSACQDIDTLNEVLVVNEMTVNALRDAGDSRALDLFKSFETKLRKA